jgi:flagellar hook-basal body complex protein FliE
MNPLSSIRLPVMPEMMRGAGMSLTPDITPRTIPEYDLAKLAPSALQSSTSIAPTGGATGGNFEGTLGRLVAEVANKDVAAKDAVGGLTSGTPLHQVMLANEEASIAFQLMVEVRNKLLESYQELMRMQV